jgi:hypothetical protein
LSRGNFETVFLDKIEHLCYFIIVYRIFTGLDKLGHTMTGISQLIFPGAILGSLLLSFFSYSITSGITLPNLSKPTVGLTSEISEVNTAPESALSEDINSDQQIITNTNPGDNDQSQDCQINKRYPDAILQWCELITRYSEKNNLDPNLVAALIWQESGGNPVAYSRSGAVGLMQVMPRDGLASSFMCRSGPCFANRPTIKELQDPQFNVKYGTNMLAGLVRKHGNVREGLKNYGPMDVGYYYADIVLNIFKKHDN